jgi:hypothetical protein
MRNFKDNREQALRRAAGLNPNGTERPMGFSIKPKRSDPIGTDDKIILHQLLEDNMDVAQFLAKLD